MVREVEFHTGIDDVAGFACRLLRKAYRAGARVSVRGDAAMLARLDVLLWTFDERDFVPHARLAAGALPPPRLAATPLWLLDDGAQAPQHLVLLNLGPQMPEDAQRHERVIELVGAAEPGLSAGRRRWRAYEQLGMTVRHHAREGSA